MMTDTELAETQGANLIFTLFYDGESLACNRAAVFNAGRKAGGRGLIL